MSKKLSRRSVLQGAAALPVVDLAGLVLQTSADIARADELHSLWLRRRELISRSCELDRVWVECRSQLPEWCLPGPKYQNSNENKEGPIVGWPETDGDLVADGDQWLLRPSPMDFRRLFNNDGGTQRQTAGSPYMEQMGFLRYRLRERRALISEIGSPRSSNWKVRDTEIESIEQIVLDLPVCPDTVATRLIIALRNRRMKSTTEDQDELDLLKASIHVYLSSETSKLSGLTLKELSKDLEI